jgi:hypothetical protein
MNDISEDFLTLMTTCIATEFCQFENFAKCSTIACDTYIEVKKDNVFFLECKKRKCVADI